MAEAVLAAYFDPPPVPDPPLITGRDVMQATGLPESPAVGRILAAVKDARDDGKVRTRDEALKLAEEFVRELGRR
jgi:poly(A) polymerase